MGILQGKKLTVPLPKIELKDIGKEKDANISDALGEVLIAINKAVIPAVQQEVAKQFSFVNSPQLSCNRLRSPL